MSLVGSDGEPVDEILLGPQTKAWYLGESYSLVFAVDMNASMASVVRFAFNKIKRILNKFCMDVSWPNVGACIDTQTIDVV